MTDAAHDALPYGIEPPGYRLPSKAHLGRVRLQIADLERSVAYYETIIGLRVVERGAGVATLGPHGDSSVLVELREKSGAAPVARRGHIGLYHFAILLPDRASLGRFIEHLAAMGEYAGMSDHFVSEAVYLQDPDGLGIEVYADRPRSAWRHSARELSMTTEALDVRSVVAAGDGVRWTGMPPGTVIGHVHLHVRDIESAERFYHAGLGFDKVVWSYPGALFLSAGGYHHHLGTNTWAAASPAAGSDDARLVDWQIVVPGAAALEGGAASLEQAGFVVTRNGAEFSARDPWGTVVRVTASE